MSRARSDQFYSNLQPIQPNAIQVAANRFAADPRPVSGVAPKERKISISQGMLYNDRVRTYKDLSGRPINTEVGVLFDMGGIRFALEEYGKYLSSNPAATAYSNPKDPLMAATEPLIREVAFGADSALLKQNLVTTIPLISQADAFREALRFLQQLHPDLDTIVFSSNGYSPHYGVIKQYFAPEKTVMFHLTTPEGQFNLAGLEDAVKGLANPGRTLVFLQGNGQNFMGVNPSPGQVERIVDLLGEAGVVPMVDMAYQGLMEGLDADARLVRGLAEKTDLPLVVFDSWSKKGKLYGMRADYLHLVCGTQEQAATLRSVFHARIRQKILCLPPDYKIPYFMLKHKDARSFWEKTDLPEARSILASTKAGLVQGLGEEFSYMQDRLGMFGYFPITHEGIDVLAEEYHIYAVKYTNQDILDKDGKPIQCARILMGIAADALEHVATALKDIYSRYPSTGRHALA